MRRIVLLLAIAVVTALTSAATLAYAAAPDNPDGSTTIAFTGIVFAIPGGGGKAYVESGRDVIVFSSGGIELISSAGPSADLCEALGAAIG